VLLKKRYAPYIIFLLVAVLAFFPVSFFLYPVKYDAIDCFYPWRFHIGECLQNGQLPYWNPFQDLGYPIHADPSSGAWYPMVWIIGYFSGYTVYTIGFEFWIHLFFAGIGFYLLAKTLKFEQNYALIAGISYMLCGVFIGNAQHLPYIISAAWLPFVLHFYFRMVQERSYWNSLRAAFFLFLMVSGGYPAFTIILFYLLLLFFCIYLMKEFQQKDRLNIVHFLGRHFVFLFYTVLLCLVLFVSIYQVSPYLSRLGDFELEQALFSPFSPQSFISFITPLASATHTDYFNSDLSMRNGYFGLLPLLFFILGIFAKKPREISILFYFGIFSLLASVGEYLPVRAFLFHYVPMMNVFRFPSVFRLFFIIGALLTGIYFLKTQLELAVWKKRKLQIGALLLVLSLFIWIIIARSKGYLSLISFMKTELFTDSATATYWQNTAFQSLIQLVFLLLFLIALWKINDKKKFVLSVLILTLLDLFLATQLNAPSSIYSEHVTARDADKGTAILPKGFPNGKPVTIEETAHLPGIGQPYWKNVSSFQKQFSAEGFNSFSFSSYEFLESEYPQLFEKIKQNHLLLLSDSVVSTGVLSTFKKDSLFTPKQLFFEPSELSVLQHKFLKNQKGDTAILVNYDASRFEILTRTKKQQLLTIFQKKYSGWHARINGKEVPIYKSNLNFMTIIVPEGNTEITFEYKNPLVKTAFYISASTFLITLLLFGFLGIKQAKKVNKID
jgi:hypothetical protein